jgi:hypothetical protein
MSYLNKDLTSYFIKRDYPHKPIILQKGGAKKYTTTIDGHPIQIIESINRYSGNDIVFRGGKEAYPCFILSINKYKEATLTGLTKDKLCFIDGYENSRDLVRIAASLAKERGAKSLTLTDISYIKCPEKVYLSDLSMITTGKTWYESILPFNPMNPEFVEPFRKKIVEASWISIMPESAGFNTEGINITSPGSAILVLDRAKKDKRFCKFFSDNMHILLERFGVKSFKNQDWTYTII